LRVTIFRTGDVGCLTPFSRIIDSQTLSYFFRPIPFILFLPFLRVFQNLPLFSIFKKILVVTDFYFKRSRVAARRKTDATTVDNATSNDIVVAYLKVILLEWNRYIMKGEHMHVRCVTHILNLVVNDGLKDIHESIIKIRNAVRFTHASPARLHKFKMFVEHARIQKKSTM